MSKYRTAFAANARMAETNDKFTIDSNLRNRGCMVLGPNTAQNPDNLRVFEAEDVTGTLVTRVCSGVCLCTDAC